MFKSAARSKSDIAFARIDAWWREWIAAIDSLSEEEQGIPGVCGKWSVQEMMAHVDGWDLHAALVAERAGLGRVIDDAEFRGTNRRSTERYSGLGLPESRALMERTHAELLERLRAIGEIEPKWVAEDTYRHYPDHVDHILEWRSQQADERDAGLSVAAVRDRIDRSWTTWIEALNGIPLELASETGVCGTWSVKDLLGHIAVWDSHSLRYAERRHRGDPSLSDGIPWQTINEEAAERHRARAFEDLFHEMLT
ncbi:MAG: DinB family protein, partial [Thermomicrobiales bacterium]